MLTAISSFPVSAGKNSESGQHSYISSSSAVGSLFFRLACGHLFHNVQSIIFRSPMEDPTGRFTTSSPMVCLRASLICPVFPSRSCCFRPRSLMPLFHFDCVRRLFPNVSPLGVRRTPSSLVRCFSAFR
jgi:hypothetical protein